MTEHHALAHPIRYLRLGYARLQVTDLARSVAFYRDLMGLALERETGSGVWLRCSDKPYDLILDAGSEPGLKGVGFELPDAAELERAFAHIAARGYAPKWYDADEAALRRVERGFVFANSDTGLALDYYCGQTPTRTPYDPPLAQIERLGHVVLNVADYAAAHRFWIDDLGFEISDHVPGSIAFLRCWPNNLHHSLALVEGPADSLNHVNFMVTDIDDIGRGMNRMKAAGVPIVFGPGRHLPSTSIFLYFLDPDGMTAEYSFGMEVFPEVDARPPRELEKKAEVLDTWGSIADPRFGKRGAIVQAHG